MNKTIMIEGMMCQNCVRHIKEAFEKKGENVTVSLEEKKAVLKNTKMINNEIKELIEELGYEVVEIK